VFLVEHYALRWRKYLLLREAVLGLLSQGSRLTLLGSENGVETK
jgi:hypothetical protein